MIIIPNVRAPKWCIIILHVANCSFVHRVLSISESCEAFVATSDIIVFFKRVISGFRFYTPRFSRYMVVQKMGNYTL